MGRLWYGERYVNVERASCGGSGSGNGNGTGARAQRETNTKRRSATETMRSGVAKNQTQTHRPCDGPGRRTTRAAAGRRSGRCGERVMAADERTANGTATETKRPVNTTTASRNTYSTHGRAVDTHRQPTGWSRDGEADGKRHTNAPPHPRAARQRDGARMRLNSAPCGRAWCGGESVRMRTGS